ncbi:MAG: DUF3786 domain-containing protein [Candidatus Adiutrix sp.]|jgi:hypothetical protein|nr:DUF3786 domain-containing protein [Candidatus Adiutrix sp.]
MARAKSAANWDNYCRKQLEELQAADPAVQAPALGLGEADGGRVGLRFFGRDYLWADGTLKAADGGEAGLRQLGLMAHYLMSRGRGELKGDYLPLGRLTGITVTGQSPSDNLTKPLLTHFGDHYQLFSQAAEKAGGRSQGRAPSGAEAWLFTPLPRLPIQVLFFEADDEFEAEIKVLFDASAPVFVAYEALELAEMVLVEELLRAAGQAGGCGRCAPGQCPGA